MLILTKPLGVGIICTAQRMKQCSEAAYQLAVRSMTTLNKYAAELAHQYDVHACTDVTGFGFLGHLNEMLGESIPVEQILKERIIPCRNRIK